MSETSYLAKNLEFLLNKQGLNANSLQDKSGITQSTTSRILNGSTKNPRDNVLKQYVDFFGVSVSDLRYKDLAGQGEMTANKTESNARFSDAEIAFWSKGDDVPDGMVAIDFLPEVRGKMGNGYINGDYHEVEQLWFREDTLYECDVNSNHAKAIHVAGDSMFPELIDGQAIAIDTSARRIFDGEIYAFRVGDELKVKYLFRHGDGFRAVSRNDDKLRYPDEVYTANQIESDNIEIIGQFWWKSETRRVRR